MSEIKRRRRSEVRAPELSRETEESSVVGGEKRRLEATRETGGKEAELAAESAELVGEL